MSARVGQDIESICGKCGDVWHVVVAMVGSTVAKVQCKQCGGYHRHSSGPKAARAPRAPRSKSTRLTPGDALKLLPSAPMVRPDLSLPMRAYQASESYAPGEQVAHPKFGEGVVESSPGPGKIQVWFPDGRLVLAQAKPASQLERGPRAAVVVRAPVA